jgi:hypothetical protein
VPRDTTKTGKGQKEMMIVLERGGSIQTLSYLDRKTQRAATHMIVVYPFNSNDKT